MYNMPRNIPEKQQRYNNNGRELQTQNTIEHIVCSSLRIIGFNVLYIRAKVHEEEEERI